MQPHRIHCKITHRKQTRWCLAYSIPPTLFSRLDFTYFYSFLICSPSDSFYKCVFYYTHNLGAAHITPPEHKAVHPQWCGLPLGLEAAPRHAARGTRHRGSRWWPRATAQRRDSPYWVRLDRLLPDPPRAQKRLPSQELEVKSTEVTSTPCSHPEAWSHTPTQRTGSTCHGPRVMRN